MNPTRFVALARVACEPAFFFAEKYLTVDYISLMPTGLFKVSIFFFLEAILVSDIFLIIRPSSKFGNLSDKVSHDFLC